MIKIQRAHLRTATKRFWGAVFTFIIALAVCVQLGRQAFPLLQDYKYEIIGFFGKELGVVVEVESLQADWSGMRPKLSLNRVRLKSLTGDTVFKIDNASIELSLISSFVNRRFTWRQIVFDGFETRFAQDDKGRWSIPGMPEFTQDPDKPSRFSFDDPYDLFLIGRRINIADAKFTLDYFNGESASVFVPDISIENDFDFRRIIASVDVGEGEETMSLVIEGDGDPRKENFIANGYFELNKFPTKSVLKVLAISDDVLSAEAHRSSIRLWFQSDAAKGLILRGDLVAEGEMTVTDGSFLAPKMFSTSFVGTLDADRGWDLSLRDINLQWDDRESPVPNLRLNGDLLGVKGLAISEIDVAQWSDLALYVGLENNKQAKKYIKGVNPRGLLKNVHLAITDKESGYFTLSAIVENGESDAIMGAPALKNIQGYLQTSLRSGRFDVTVNNGLTLDLPKVYKRAMTFEKAQGQLRWFIDYESSYFYISSSLVTLETEYEKGTGYVHLSLPFKKEFGPQALTLSLGVEHAEALRHKVYVPKTIPSELYAWLGRSIKGGEMKNAEFIYHGPLESGSDVAPSLQLRGRVENASLKYDASWPELTKVNAHLLLDNDEINIRVDSASIMGNTVQNAQVNLVRDPVEGGPALAITAALEGQVTSTMALLKNSPISDVIGTEFDDWEMSGRLNVLAKLLVPIDAKSSGHSQFIDARFINATAFIPDINIELNNISGKLYYDSDKGLFANALNAKVWGEKVKGKISSRNNAEGGQDIRIFFNSKVDVDDLYTWTSRPELKFTDGKTEVSGSLFIPAGNSKRPLQADFSSTLEGVTINMTAPFGKPADEKTSFSARIRAYPHAEEYQFSLADKLKVSLLVDENSPVSGIVEVNEFRRRKDVYSPIPKTDRFDVSGYFDSLDLEQWIAAKNQYFIYVAAALEHQRSQSEDVAPSPSSSPEIQVSYDLFINEFLLGDFAIEKLSVKGERSDAIWLMDVKSELLAGAVEVAEDDRPIKMDLDYVRLDEEVSEEVSKEVSKEVPKEISEDETLELAKGIADEFAIDGGETSGAEQSSETVNAESQGLSVKPVVTDDETQQALVLPSEREANENSIAPEVPKSILAGVDLNSAVELDFSTKELSIGETDYGRWAFKLRPMDGGVFVQEIFAETKAMRVGEDGVGAEFIWLKDGEQQSSQFKGVVTAKNLADVFAAWEQEKLLESESARFTIDAKWPGAPDEVSLKGVEGLINVSLRRGSFTRGAGSDENDLLRLIAVFNFDTIVRRLRLDFSDLTAQGYSFDSVKGKLLFRDGIIYLTEPMIVKSSSSDTQLAGTVDLIEEKLDAELVVTLPVASNIAVATALVVGLPAALGVYVMSKMFKKQVDRASSLNISVAGDWEDPKVKIKKIFDIGAAERRSKKLKDDAKSPKDNANVVEDDGADTSSASPEHLEMDSKATD